MRSIVAVGFAGAALAAPPSVEKDWTGYTFDQYVKDFEKMYGDNEFSDRKRNFEITLEKVLTHNAQKDKEWFATINKFSDMSKTEFKGFVKGKGPMPWLGEKYDFKDTVNASLLPDSVDWRTTAGVVTAVKDQGICGSCWAFSATESFESHLALATGENAQKLSAQQIVDCTPNPNHCGGTGGCDGATEPLAFNYTSTIGLVTEQDYPYKETTGTCKDKRAQPVGINTGYTELPPNDYNALMTAVATKGPVSIGVAAGGDTWQLYGGGIASCANDGAEGWDLDHGVNLVGYGTQDGKDYWLVRNSWAADFGEHGYIRLRRFGDGKEPCGTDKTPQDGDACKGDNKPRHYCGTCAILGSSSYPTGMKKMGPSPGPSPPSPSPPGPAPPGPYPPRPKVCWHRSPTNACGTCTKESDCGFNPFMTLCKTNDPQCSAHVIV